MMRRGEVLWCKGNNEGLNLASHKNHKLRVFDQRLEGSRSPFYDYFDKCQREINNNVQLTSFWGFGVGALHGAPRWRKMMILDVSRKT